MGKKFSKFGQLISSLMLAFSVLVLSVNARAGGDEPIVIPDADTIIKHCWDISLELRSSPSVDAMRAGNLDTALCLEKAIIDNAADFIEPSSLTRDQIAAKMKEIRFALGGFYWSLYNEHKGCPFPSCGRFFHPAHNAFLAQAYEDILRNVIAQRKDYKR